MGKLGRRGAHSKLSGVLKERKRGRDRDRVSIEGRGGGRVEEQPYHIYRQKGDPQGKRRANK